MKIRLWRIFRQLLGEPRLLLRYLDRSWITLDETDYLQRSVLVTGMYEPEVWDALSSVAEHDEIVWDVGANIGTFAIRAVVDPRVSRVHAFEPDPITAALLELHNRLN